MIDTKKDELTNDFKNTPLKYDAKKSRVELIPPEFLIGIGNVLGFGASKYSAGNWASGDGFEWSRLYGAMLRHMLAWASGEDKDPESGLSHLYHAGCMLAFLAAHVERQKGADDRMATGVASFADQPGERGRMTVRELAGALNNGRDW